MKNYIILFSLTLLYTSCGCPNSIELGSFLLTDDSRAFFVYDEDAQLSFIDQDNVEHELTVRTIERNEHRMYVNTLCDEGTFDKQYEFYNIEREQISFWDAEQRQVFYLDLITQFEDNEDLNDIAIYDQLLINGTLFSGDQTYAMYGKILTATQQNEVSDNHRENFIEDSRFIGDTTMYGTNYTEVYEGLASGLESILYYSLTDGVVVMYGDDDHYWILKK